MLADLHCHSLKSDGDLSPSDLVDRAAEQGVTMLALTDHDTINGLVEARARAEMHNIELVSGIEISTVWNGIGIHVVGLGFDEHHPALLEAIARQEDCRLQRAKTIAERLEKLGIEGIWEKAEAIANGAQIGRPHFAQALIDMGKVSNMAQAFKRFLGAGKPGDVKTMWPDISEVVGWIRAAGGVAVVAHPDKYKMTGTKLKCMLKAFAEAGGNGLEVVSGATETTFSRRMVELCDEFGFLASQGSDFHGPRPWSELGKFTKMPEGATPVWTHWAASA
jgi:predicted metal-dependent phosphoesterase TrpH